jgi:asparagine synthetase B (glutamine-hydrolysing)
MRFNLRMTGMSTVELKRDWLGIVPLHYMVVDGSIIAAPTIKELMRYPQYSYERVQTVRSGHIVHYNPSAGKIETEKYYELPETAIKDSTEVASKKIRSLLEAGIEERLKGVTAVMLSGGPDSTIAAYLARGVNPDVVAYCMIVEGSRAEDLDLPHAYKAAKELGMELVEVRVSPEEVRESIDEVIFAAEDKRDYNVSSAAGTFPVGKRIYEDGHKEFACGEGADEALGSYKPWGSYTLTQEEAVKPENRRKFVKNLEWNLSRGTKVARYLGLDIISPFLTRDFMEYAVNLPAGTASVNGHPKGVLAMAFPEISEEFTLRKKTRFQDGSGITPVLEKAKVDKGYIEKTFNERFRVGE